MATTWCRDEPISTFNTMVRASSSASLEADMTSGALTMHTLNSWQCPCAERTNLQNARTCRVANNDFQRKLRHRKTRGIQFVEKNARRQGHGTKDCCTTRHDGHVWSACMHARLCLRAVFQRRLVAEAESWSVATVATQGVLVGLVCFRLVLRSG
jgi:hypothetical protein